LSISKIRNSFDSKGCQVVLVVVGLLLAVGLLYTGTCQALTGAGQPADGTQPVIVVDGRPISDRALGDAVRRSQELTFQNTGAVRRSLTRTSARPRRGSSSNRSSCSAAKPR
jgi:hypothetical protein